MSETTALKDAAISYMRAYGIIEKIQTTAVRHSRNGSKTSPYMPLIIDLEVDLILLYDLSPDLYDKIVGHPALGRSIFQEALYESLNDYLRAQRCLPLASMQLLLRSTFSSTLVEANGLFAKSCHCLSYMRRCVLIGLTVPRSNACNVVTICVLSRCPDESCTGHAGQYVSMDELPGNEPLGKCFYCGKKGIEDPKGRGQVGRVMAKFETVVGACGNREESAECTTRALPVICSIKEPLSKELELGDMYDLWGRYTGRLIFEVWGLRRTSFFSARLASPLSPFSPSIRGLLASLGEPELRDPWTFVRKLSVELGSDNYRRNAAASLRMGLLLSLATLGGEKCAPILCVGPKIGMVEKDIMNRAANCADRRVPATLSVSSNTTKNGTDFWFHSGSLLRAKAGVCNVGNWDRLKAAQKNHLVSVLDDGYITIGRKNRNNDSEGDDVECGISSSLPLRTAVWTYLRFRKSEQQQSVAVQNLTNVFGMAVVARENTGLFAEDVHERFETLLHGAKVNPRAVPIGELTEFLRYVNSFAVTLSDEAIKLMKDYFVKSRKVRGDVFPARSNTFMTTLAEAHARLSLRNRVTDDDVIAVIYLYEEAMDFLYGQSIATAPLWPFVELDIETIADNMQVFKRWLTKYLN